MKRLMTLGMIAGAALALGLLPSATMASRDQAGLKAHAVPPASRIPLALNDDDGETGACLHTIIGGYRICSDNWSRQNCDMTSGMGVRSAFFPDQTCADIGH